MASSEKVEKSTTNSVTNGSVFAGSAMPAFGESGKKQTQTQRVRLGGGRGWYSNPSIPKMKWLGVNDVDEQHPLGNVTTLTPEDLVDEVFHCGVPLLELLDDAAGSYQLTSPWAVLGNALCTAAMDEPDAVVETGMDSGTMPTNFIVVLNGQSGGGKGSSMRTPLKMATDLTFPAHKTPASGEALVPMFYEKVEVDQPDGRGTKSEWVRRIGGVWINWDEVDAFVAKSGAANQSGKVAGSTPTTLSAHIRSLFIGGQVGDEAVSRDASNAYLERNSYRFVCTVQGTPDRMGAFVNDATGGTVQRTLFFPTRREDDRPTGKEVRARKEAFCKKLGLQTMAKGCPSLVVWGPGGNITVTDEVVELLEEGLISNHYGERPPEEGHIDAVRIRLAAIFAGWRAGYHRDAVIDVDAWWWACCVTERSRRMLVWTKEQVGAANNRVANDLGRIDAVRKRAQMDAQDEIGVTKIYPKVYDRVPDLIQRIKATDFWNNRPRVRGTLATRGDISVGLSGKSQRDYLDDAIAQHVNEGTVIVVPDTEGRARYDNAADAYTRYAS